MRRPPIDAVVSTLGRTRVASSVSAGSLVAVEAAGGVVEAIVAGTDGTGGWLIGPVTGLTPLPVNWTSCRPDESSPLIAHVPLVSPTAVGVKVTCSTTLAPGAIVSPSGRLVIAANAPPTGGLDLVIVTSVPPVLATVKLLVAVVPIVA